METLFETLKVCVNNKKAYFNVVKTNKPDRTLIISKYEKLPYYELVITDNSNHIIKTYNKLSPYDCYDLINNLKESYICD